jgi:hypothetical protein
MSDSHHRAAETVRAWDLAAGKYAEAIDADMVALLAGALDLSPPEREVLLPLVSRSTRLVHLQCSHGQSALGLWRATECEVVGLDGAPPCSRSHARKRGDSKRRPVASASQADVLAPPPELAGWQRCCSPAPARCPGCGP